MVLPSVTESTSKPLNLTIECSLVSNDSLLSSSCIQWTVCRYRCSVLLRQFFMTVIPWASAAVAVAPQARGETHWPRSDDPAGLFRFLKIYLYPRSVTAGEIRCARRKKPPRQGKRWFAAVMYQLTNTNKLFDVVLAEPFRDFCFSHRSPPD